MSAKPVLEVTDTLAFFCVFARLLACLNVWHFASRALQENFTGTAVALEIGTDLDPGTWRDFQAERDNDLLIR